MGVAVEGALGGFSWGSFINRFEAMVWKGNGVVLPYLQPPG